MDKLRPARVIGVACLAGGLCMLALGSVGALSPLLTLLVCSAGFCMSVAQTGLNAFAPGCYPTVHAPPASTGCSAWAGFSSMLGSAFGGALLGLGRGFGTILALLELLALLALLAIVAAIAVLLSNAAARRRSACNPHPWGDDEQARPLTRRPGPA